MSSDIILQDDGPVPVVKIDYTADFSKVMGQFRRVLHDGEYSERSLLLSSEVIQHNAANYTAWQYRRTCLGELHKAASEEARRDAWRQEKDYCTVQCLRNMKNYQVWFHRRACAIGMSGAADGAGTPNADAREEMDFIASIIREDNKNYHAWGYRQWALAHFSKDFPAFWDEELTFVNTLIESDLRNNSAWNQSQSPPAIAPPSPHQKRVCAISYVEPLSSTDSGYFVLKNTADLTSQELLSSELEYAFSYLKKAPNNPSPWAYIEGLVGPVGFSSFPQLRSYCEALGNPPAPEAQSSGQVIGAASTADHCVPALALLARILQSSNVASDVSAAKALCTELTSMDPVRARFWRWRAAPASVREMEGNE